MLRSLLLLLCLTVSAACQEVPRGWLVTMDDLKSHWPARYHFNRAEEKLTSSPGLTISSYRYQYVNRLKGVVIYDSLTRSNSKLKAEFGYATFGFAAHHNGDSQSVDYSKQIKAGDASQCRLLHSDVWVFAYRKNRIWGALVIGGLKLKPEEMSHEVKAWVNRVEVMETRRKNQSGSLWSFFRKKPQVHH
jgi:hypothetical protein